MALEGCYSCIKYLMFAFNFLFWLVGCALIGIGIWIKVSPDTLMNVTKNSEFEEMTKDFSSHAVSSTSGYLLIGVGAAIMIIGFLGCCGAIRESQCMLATFFVLIFIIFAVLVGVGIYAIVNKEKLKKEISKALEETVDRARTDQKANDSMTFIQKEFHCCGADKGYSDYKFEPLGPLRCNPDYLNVPCSPKVYEKMSQNIVVIAGVTVGIAAVLFIGMTFSLLLCCAIREQMDVGKRY